MTAYLVALLCVLGLATGQFLFKLTSIALASTGTLFSVKSALPFISAMAIYGVTSIAWVWVLQKIELGRVYPMMALAFVFVPLGSHFIFGERFQAQYFIGLVMIVVGIIITIRG
ncbi:4-amino-4-deoxy-L-arabinose-phospho-UDP flippase [Pseudomonas sp. BE134]|uniref:4-amino-4-deoxy-L-arabinose-phospho-UDP flippase n=1 Tax=Pseudomonas sp. BE134 TaxID=2817843 RepID=UPI002865751D|nr:4-amino-4-deoxy-L-arabinose-phospho-UDP flippase [Pseudomonas sp. BE134]MDR6926903.1 drug/metabolite transporter (DMT)-like permease [Pseudomonas sp. BE134]